MLIAFVLCSCLWNAQWSESEIKYYLSIYLSKQLRSVNVLVPVNLTPIFTTRGNSDRRRGRYFVDNFWGNLEVSSLNYQTHLPHVDTTHLSGHGYFKTIGDRLYSYLRNDILFGKKIFFA